MEKLQEKMKEDYIAFTEGNTAVIKYYAEYVDRMIEYFPYFQDICLISKYFLASKDVFLSSLMSKIDKLFKILLYDDEETPESEEIHTKIYIEDTRKLRDGLTINSTETVFREVLKILNSKFEQIEYTYQMIEIVCRKAGNKDLVVFFLKIIEKENVISLLLKGDCIFILLRENMNFLEYIIDTLQKLRENDDIPSKLDQCSVLMMERFITLGLIFGFVDASSEAEANLVFKYKSSGTNIFDCTSSSSIMALDIRETDSIENKDEVQEENSLSEDSSMIIPNEESSSIDRENLSLGPENVFNEIHKFSKENISSSLESLKINQERNTPSEKDFYGTDTPYIDSDEDAFYCCDISTSSSDAISPETFRIANENTIARQRILNQHDFYPVDIFSAVQNRQKYISEIEILYRLLYFLCKEGKRLSVPSVYFTEKNFYTLYYLRIFSYSAIPSTYREIEQVVRLFYDEEKSTHLYISSMRIILRTSAEYLESCNFFNMMYKIMCRTIALESSSYIQDGIVLWSPKRMRKPVFSFLLKIYNRFYTHISKNYPHWKGFFSFMDYYIQKEKVQVYNKELLFLEEYEGFQRYTIDMFLSVVPYTSVLELDVNCISGEE